MGWITFVYCFCSEQRREWHFLYQNTQELFNCISAIQAVEFINLFNARITLHLMKFTPNSFELATHLLLICGSENFSNFVWSGIRLFQTCEECNSAILLKLSCEMNAHVPLRHQYEAWNYTDVIRFWLLLSLDFNDRVLWFRKVICFEPYPNKNKKFI